MRIDPCVECARLIDIPSDHKMDCSKRQGNTRVTKYYAFFSATLEIEAADPREAWEIAEDIITLADIVLDEVEPAYE